MALFYPLCSQDLLQHHKMTTVAPRSWGPSPRPHPYHFLPSELMHVSAVYGWGNYSLENGIHDPEAGTH